MIKLVKNFFLCVFSLTIFASTYVKSDVKTSATGDNVNVNSEIITIVNGKETKVTSDQPGEITVEINDDQVNIVTKTPDKFEAIVTPPSKIKPTIIIEEKITQKKEELNLMKTNFIQNIINRINRFFQFNLVKKLYQS